MLVAYSTAAGQYAQDGTGELSPYARSLIEALRAQVPTVLGNWPVDDLIVSRK